jgi:3-hydroxy acid dehydrogenase / malonic semialdehyde reductase
MTDIETTLITGATSGIGRACAHAFSRLGSRIIATGRRAERLDQLAEQLPGEVRPLVFDVRDREQVTEALDGLPEGWRAIDVLVNNAGLALGKEPMHQGRLDEWTQMLETNVIGLLNVTNWVLPRMVERGRGHIINIGSNAGREVYPGGAVYCASKAAVDRITKGMRMDALGTGVRISEVDPGMVETEFSEIRFRGDTDAAGRVYEGLTPLSADDVAETVLWVATRPPHVQIADVLIYPTDQAGAGKVARHA